MKVNKWTSLACLGIAIISILIILVINIYTQNNNSVVVNIFLGLFTSSLVSMAISIVGYIHEKAVLIEKAKNNLKSLYMNMYAHSRMIGKALEKIHTSSSLENLPFKNISSLSQYNINFLNNMELGLFSPVLKNSRLSQVYNRLIEFQSILYNIKNISVDLEILTLQYTYDYLQLQNNQMQGIQPNVIQIQNLDSMKNLINIRTAKLHEHTTDRMLQLEKIAKEFFDCKGGKQSWEKIKSNLLLQVEDIIKG